MIDPKTPVYTEYKKKLVKNSPSEIEDFDDFYSIFLDISSLLPNAEVTELQSVLKLDVLSIWLTRALQLSRINQSFIGWFLGESSFSRLLDIFNYICHTYVSTNGPLANATFGLLTKLLQFIQRFEINSGDTTINLKLTEMLMTIPASQKSFYIIAEVFLKEIDGSASTLTQEAFSQKCLDVMSSANLANLASKALACYFSRLIDPKENASDYVTAWSPIIKESLYMENRRANIIYHLLPKLFRPCPQRFFPWLKSLNIEKNSTEWRLLSLPLLKCGFLISSTNDPIAAGALSEPELLDSLKHTDEKCRRDSFALVCSAITATSMPPEYALNTIMNPLILQIFFRESLTPEARNDFFSLLRKSLLNCRDFVITQEKRLSKKQDCELESTIEELKSILRAIFDFVVSQLCPDSSYTQLSLSTDFLRFFVEFEFDGVCRDPKRNSKGRLAIFEIFSPKLASTLLRFVSNNYEDIRVQCAYIFSFCPSEIFDQINRRTMMINTAKLLSSVKGRQSDGAAKVLKCITEKYIKEDKIERLIECMSLIMSSMNDGLKKHETMKIHGHFTALAEILSSTPTYIYEDYHLSLNSIINTLLHTSQHLWDILKPEMIFAPTDAEENSESSSWRTIKENSLLLKVIIKVNYDTRFQCFDHSALLKLGSLLMDQLSHISHRGAFSAIYPTFVQLCELCYVGELENKPFEWLKANLKLLETKEQLISRRSAGIPLLLNAILESSVRQKLKVTEYFDFTFKELFRLSKMAHIPSDDEKNDIPQVHAFNCMRYIFRDSSLAFASLIYLDKALAICLSNLSHSVWAIKNGAVMLFTTLQERLFGSQTGESSSAKNASVFFAKHAEIRDVLLDKLNQHDDINATFLVLSVLLRLQTFSELDYILAPFKKIIMERILGHKVWKIRELAARLLCTITHPHDKLGLVSLLTLLIETFPNLIHGKLMCLLELAKTSEELKDPILSFAEKWFLKTKKWHWINARAALLILMTQEVPESVTEKLIIQIEQLTSQEKSSLDGGVRLFLDTAVTCVLKSLGGSNQICLISKRFMEMKQYEVQLATARFWKENCDTFADLTELQALVMDVMRANNTWSYVRMKYMCLLVESGVALPKTFELKESSKLTRCLNLVLQARLLESGTELYLNLLKPFLADSQPEEIRRLCVLAIQSLILKTKKDYPVNANLLFSLYTKLSDDSDIVRSMACIDDGCSEVSRPKILQELTERFPKQAFDILLRQLRNSVLESLFNLNQEMANVQFEIEKCNLFRNEIRIFEEVTESIASIVFQYPDFQKEMQEVVSTCIATVKRAIDENEELISTWTLNVHLDSAIRKMICLRSICSDTERDDLDKVRSRLEEKLYFL